MVRDKQRTFLLSMVDKSPKNSRSSIKHAWIQIDKARLLAGVDNEMAAFRAITAEEEAATGIIKELQSLGYNRASMLKSHNHSHKAGIWHLLIVVSNFMKEVGPGELLDLVVTEGSGDLKGKLIISFPSPIPGDLRWANPTPPLNINIINEGTRVGFKRQADELASVKSATTLKKLIDNEANIRNELIYASHEGVPNVKDSPLAFINDREKRVMVLTYAYLLISQYREKQIFVQQCLDAYLKLLERNVDDIHSSL